MEKLYISNEAELVRQAAQGSNEAFAMLVRAHQEPVRCYLARFVHNATVVDDLAQEVFLRAYQHLETFRGDATLRSWLFGVARNLAKEHIRGELRRRQRETGTLAIQLARWRLEQLDQPASDRDEQEITIENLLACVDRLPATSRQLVEEHYFKRLTLEAIAQRQDRTAGSLRMLLLRIRKALARCVAQSRKEQA